MSRAAATEPRDGHALIEWNEDPVWGGSFVNGKWERTPTANGIFVNNAETWPETAGNPYRQTGRLKLRTRCDVCRSRLIYDPERLRAFCSDTYPTNLR